MDTLSREATLPSFLPPTQLWSLGAFFFPFKNIHHYGEEFIIKGSKQEGISYFPFEKWQKTQRCTHTGA